MAVTVASQAKPKSKKKNDCINKVKQLIEKYPSIIVFNCDNIGSNQLKKVRVLTREHGELIMGKNTLFKKGFMAKMDKSGKLDRVIPQIFGNIGLIFTNKNLKEVRDILESVSEMAPVKPGIIAQCDVTIPKGLTSLPPDKTSFFQALSISTMINKSAIEIMSDIHLLKKGQKVGASEATLLQMLDIRPFSYRLHSKYIYDNGMGYPPEILDIRQTDILASFKDAVSDIAAISLAVNYPTRVSVPHLVQTSLRELLAVCLEADITNDFVTKYKASSVAAAAAAPVVVAAAPVKAVETKAAPAAKEAPKKEDSDEDMGLGLFGDD